MAIVEDLLQLIADGELGHPAPGGRERWVLDCARRAVAAHVERMRPEAPGVRATLEQGLRWIDVDVSVPERDAVLAPLHQAIVAIDARAAAIARAQRRHSVALAARAVEAVVAAVELVARGSEVAPGDYARVAHHASVCFPDPPLEAAAQARRLLVFTRLLPTGPELLVRLDHAEAAGLLPADPAARAWIEHQRVALMADDEPARMAVLLRALDVVFGPQLRRRTPA